MGARGAVDGIMGELVDGFGLGVGGGFGKVRGGDLQAVEEEAGAFGVKGVGGEAAEDLADGELDGGAVVGLGQGKGGLAAAAILNLGFGDGFAGGVMVVAKFILL